MAVAVADAVAAPVHAGAGIVRSSHRHSGHSRSVLSSRPKELPFDAVQMFMPHIVTKQSPFGKRIGGCGPGTQSSRLPALPRGNAGVSLR
jgi:hypothetical protein